MFRRILVALDGGPARLAALHTAADLARQGDGTVHVLHIAATAQAYETTVPLEDDSAAQAVLSEAVRTLYDAGVPAEGELLTGTVADIPTAITATAERTGADLLILAPHHRGALAAWLNPRVSDAVSHTTRIPVLLVPAQE